MLNFLRRNRMCMMAFAVGILFSIVTSDALAAPQRPPKKQFKMECATFGGFLGCTILGQMTGSCLLPWGDCNKKVIDLVCREQNKQARDEWEKSGKEGPPYQQYCD